MGVNRMTASKLDITGSTKKRDIVSELEEVLGDTAEELFNQFMTMNKEKLIELANDLFIIKNWIEISYEQANLSSNNVFSPVEVEDILGKLEAEIKEVTEIAATSQELAAQSLN
jgi:hypothetical protein